MNVSVAIPNYNGEKFLHNLLKRLSKENFSNIYILDDHSTDSSSKVASEFSKVTFVKGSSNLGPPGNLNRVLDYDIGDILFSIDVDMEILSENLVGSIVELFSKSNITQAGGLIISDKDEPMWYNWGYEMNPARDLKANYVDKKLIEYWGNKRKIDQLARKYPNVSPNIDISFGTKRLRKVDWVSEGCFSIRSDVFRKIGGFDSNMRYHAGQDLGKRLRELGYGVYFSPYIKVKHLNQDTYMKGREYEQARSAEYFLKKHKITPP